MSRSVAVAPHASAASDLARLSIPLLIITASIVTALWIDHGSVGAADEASGAAPSAQVATP
jgi:hypothetical protein